MHTSPKTDYFNDTLQNKAIIFLPGEGKKLTAGEGSCTLKVTSDISNNELGIYEIVVPPHTAGARLHYHRYMDETFIVKQGTLTLQTAEKESHLEEGSLIYVPRFTPHAFSNTTDLPVTITLIFNPSQQREGFFHGMFELLNEPEMDMAKFLKLYHKYDSFIVDPITMQPL